MYEIYINTNKLILADNQQVKNIKSIENHLIAPYSGKSKSLFSYIDMMEKSKRFGNIIIHFHDKKKLIQDFQKLYVIVKAAGGVVNNGSGKVLFIFRRGYWDLPKGKIDPGEKKKAAAIREVEEETGITQVTLGKKIRITRHTYRLKNGKRAIKRTHWYAMSAPQQKLVPQIEEDITEAKWIDLTNGYILDRPAFKNIDEVILDYLEK